MRNAQATDPVTTLAPLDPSIAVTIVVVNWNTKDLLRACLESLRQDSDESGRQIIIVDNASRDGSAQMVASEFPEAQLIVNTRNRGFAAANNQGIAAARGRYLLLLNSDTQVPPGAVAVMARYLDDHPCVGAVGPRLLNADGSLQSSARDFPRMLWDGLAILEVERWPLVSRLAHNHVRRATLYWSDHRYTRAVDWLMGACLMLRREAIEQAGALDEGYFFFAEEMDLCHRLWRLGWSVDFLAGAEIVHLGGQSASQVPAARLVWHYSGLLRFYRLHRSAAQRATLRALIALAMLARIAGVLVKHHAARPVRPLLSAYARVLARAVRG